MKRIITFSLLAALLAFGPAAVTQVSEGSSTVKRIKIGKAPVVTSRTVKGGIPDLVIKNEVFNDPNSNNTIDGGESAYINFKVQNLGTGTASKVVVSSSLMNGEIKGLTYTKRIELGDIPPNSTKDVSIQLKAAMDLVDSRADFKFEVTEAAEFDAYPLEMKIETQPFQPPNVVVADAVFSTESGGKIVKMYPIQLKILLQNIGRGEARNINMSINFQSTSCKPIDTTRYSFLNMKPGETREVNFSFLVTRKYSDPSIPVSIKLTESYLKYSRDTLVSVNLDQQLQAQNAVVIAAIATPEIDIKKQSLTSDVDKNIPTTTMINEDKFALIIGNEDYSKYQPGLSTEANVAFARNDATVFREYAIKTLGIPEKNVFYELDATTGGIRQKLEVVSKLVASRGANAELIFYYAGHGLPDEVTHIPYLIPVDVSGSNITSAIKVSEIYQKFGETKAKKITVFMDACFTGGGRESGLLAARSVKVKPSEENLSGNLVVFSATTGEQSALPYTQEKHGMFTYYLLKKLQESGGNITYKDLDSYLGKNVTEQSLRVNTKDQNPTVNVSPDVIDTWQTWKLK